MAIRFCKNPHLLTQTHTATITTSHAPLTLIELTLLYDTLCVVLLIYTLPKKKQMIFNLVTDI